jgi:hypothetical protein
MKKPRQNSNEPDLVSGQVLFGTTATYTSSSQLVTPPFALSRYDVVAVSIDDSAGTYPYALNLILTGAINSTGQVEIRLENPIDPTTVSIPDIRINFIVLPRCGTPSAP